jgi:hypothetical protein
VKGSGGNSKSQFASGVTVTAAGLALPNLTVAVMDLSDLSKRLFDSPVEMILGREFFDAGKWRIDIDGGSIRLLDRLENPRSSPYQLTSARGIESMPVKVEGVPTQAAVNPQESAGEVNIGPSILRQLAQKT